MPRVSVVLPVRNAAATIGAAVQSIRGQTFTDWELIVIDDGSRDESPRICAALAETEPRMRLLQQPAAGIVAALNAGLAVARGELIARMDGDDESLQDRLAAQVAWLDENPALGLAACLVEFGGDRERNAGYALHVDWLNALVTREEIALRRFVESPLAHPSVMFRRELVDRLGGYTAGDFPEDYELWLRWLDAGVAMAKVPRTLFRWNDPPARLSRTDARYSPEAFFAVKARWIARELARRGVGQAAMGTRPVWVWGAGRPTRKRARVLEPHGVRIEAFIDIDARKIGGRAEGKPVWGPDALPGPGKVFVLGYVGSRGARELIRAELRRRGYVEGEDFLMCA